MKSILRVSSQPHGTIFPKTELMDDFVSFLFGRSSERVTQGDGVIATFNISILELGVNP